MPIFCPKCSVYIGLRQACTCGWVEGELPPLLHPRALAVWDAPLLCKPLLVEGNRPLLIVGFGAYGGFMGGVAAFNLATHTVEWSREFTAAVTVTPALAPDGATLVVTIETGDLLGIHITDGADAWETPLHLDDSVEAPPLMPLQRSNPLLIAVTVSGRVVLVDWRNGRLVQQVRIDAESNLRCVVAPIHWGGAALLVASELRRDGRSHIYRLDASGRPHELASLAGAVYTKPIATGGSATVMVGTSEGLLCALDLGTGKSVWRFDAFKLIRASPLLNDGVLYFGSHGHNLFAVDATTGNERWRFAWHHSVNSTPAFCQGLLIFVDSAGTVAALDIEGADGAHAPRLLWSYRVEDDRASNTVGMSTAAMLGGLIQRNGVIYGASANGGLYALPGHGGDLAWAARYAQRAGHWLDAAYFTLAAAGGHRAGELAAAQLLNENGAFSFAAKLFEAIGEPTAAAAAYENAAETERLPIYYTRAAALWKQCGYTDKARKCHVLAAKLAHGPLLHLTCMGISALKVGERSKMTLLVQNSGDARARTVRIELATADFQPVRAVEWPELPVGDEGLHCDLTVIPVAAGDLNLRVIVFAQDDNGNAIPPMEWVESVRAAAPEAPPVQVHVEKFFAQGSTNFDGDVTNINRARSAGTAPPFNPQPPA